MTAGQIAVKDGRLGAPILIALVITAFAVGLVTGFGLLRAAESGNPTAAAEGPGVQAQPGYGPWSDYVDSSYAAAAGPVIQAQPGYGPWSDYVDSSYATVHSPAVQAQPGYGPWSDYVDSSYATAH